MLGGRVPVGIATTTWDIYTTAFRQSTLLFQLLLYFLHVQFFLPVLIGEVCKHFDELRQHVDTTRTPLYVVSSVGSTSFTVRSTRTPLIKRKQVRSGSCLWTSERVLMTNLGECAARTDARRHRSQFRRFFRQSPGVLHGSAVRAARVLSEVRDVPCFLVGALAMLGNVQRRLV